MTVNELTTATARLIFKINIITGWQLYDDPADQLILEEQFRLKLVESYPLVNCDEFEFAFRNNTSVKDWGRNLNLSLIDEVMIPYLNQRAEISRLEESKTPKMIFNNVVTTDEEKLRDIEEWKNRKDYNLYLIPPYIFNYLVDLKMIDPSNKEKWDSVKQAALLRKSQLFEESQNGQADSMRTYESFMTQFKNNDWTPEEMERCKVLGKKIMVRDYFSKA